MRRKRAIPILIILSMFLMGYHPFIVSHQELTYPNDWVDDIPVFDSEDYLVHSQDEVEGLVNWSMLYCSRGLAGR